MIDPQLAWGLVARGLGLVYLISFASIAPQVTTLAGAGGLTPLVTTLRQIKHDLPMSYWRHFPSVFWLVGASDVALTLVPVAGAAFASAAIIGTASPAALAACWALMRSLDIPVGLLYPWDSMLLEAGALALLLPAVHPIGDGLGTVSAPHPWVAASLRLLLLRVMLGFGKKKFVGTSLKHSCYIKHFLVAQPIPSPLGWLASRFPCVLALPRPSSPLLAPPRPSSPRPRPWSSTPCPCLLVFTPTPPPLAPLPRRHIPRRASTPLPPPHHLLPLPVARCRLSLFQLDSTRLDSTRLDSTRLDST